MKKLLMIPALIFMIFVLNISEAKPQLINLVVSVTGSVIDEITKDPVSVELEIFDTTGTRVSRARSNAKDGYYFMTGLKPGRKYILRNILNFDVDKQYFKQKIELEIPYTDKYTEFSKDFLLTPVSKNLEIPFKVIPFSNSKSVLRVGASNYLKDFCDLMQENQRVKFEIVCYPDNDNNVQENLTITGERTKVLKDYFVSNGINEARITVQNNGKTDPKNPPPTTKAPKGKRYKGSIYLVVKSL